MRTHLRLFLTTGAFIAILVAAGSLAQAQPGSGKKGGKGGGSTETVDDFVKRLKPCFAHLCRWYSSIASLAKKYSTQIGNTCDALIFALTNNSI